MDLAAKNCQGEGMNLDDATSETERADRGKTELKYFLQATTLSIVCLVICEEVFSFQYFFQLNHLLTIFKPTN